TVINTHAVGRGMGIYDLKISIYIMKIYFILFPSSLNMNNKKPADNGGLTHETKNPVRLRW
ncbi:hypothetical protein DBO95_25670, partial [Yersinia pestis]